MFLNQNQKRSTVNNQNQNVCKCWTEAFVILPSTPASDTLQREYSV